MQCEVNEKPGLHGDKDENLKENKVTLAMETKPSPTQIEIQKLSTSYDILNKNCETNKNCEIKESSEDCNIPKVSKLKIKFKKARNQMFCGKKRMPCSRVDTTTVEFHPIDLSSINATERSYYLANKNTSPISEVLSDQMELKLWKSGGKFSKSSSSLNTEDPYDQEINHNTKYCICQTVWDKEAIMLQCDGECQDWYHPKCLNINEEEFRRIENSDTWICPYCKTEKN